MTPTQAKELEHGDVVRHIGIDDKIWSLGEVRSVSDDGKRVFVAMFSGHDEWAAEVCELEQAKGAAK